MTNDVSLDSGFDIVVEDDYLVIRPKLGHKVTESSVISMAAELFALKVYQTEKEAGLFDFRGHEASLSYEEMKNIQLYVKENFDPSWGNRYAAFVVDSDLQFGLARMYDAMTDKIPITLRIFRTFEEAQRWIVNLLHPTPPNDE